MAGHTMRTRSMCSSAAISSTIEQSTSHELLISQVCSLLAPYLTVTELVLIRRVSSSWMRHFSQPCCWLGRAFEPTSLQIQAADIRVDAMPYLDSLVLSKCCRADRDTASMLTVLQRLAAGHNQSLTKLVTDAAVSPAVIAALPCLQQLVCKGACVPNGSDPMVASIIQQLPTTLKDLRVRLPAEDASAMNALIRQPFRQLQRLEHLYATTQQLRRLIGAHTHLTAIDIIVCRTELSAAIVAELQPATQLSELTLREATCTAALVDALSMLPLCSLTIEPSEVDVEFWDGLCKLREALTNHLPADQRHQQVQLVQLNMLAMCPTPCPNSLDDEWWVAALRASWFCSKFDLKHEGLLEHCWQQILEEPHTMESALQYLDTHCYSLSSSGRSYMMQHRNVRTLLGCAEVVEEPDIQLLSALPHLNRLITHRSCDTASPAAIRRGLTEIDALRQLTKLIVTSKRTEADGPSTLMQFLQLVEDAVSLQYVVIRARLVDWAELQLADIHQRTCHVHELSLVVYETQQQSAAEVEEIARRLLTLSNLTHLTFTELHGAHSASSWSRASLNCKELADIRRAFGLNSVQFDCTVGM